MAMTPKQWMNVAIAEAAISVQVIVSLARRNGVDLGSLWSAWVAAGAALADKGEEAVASEKPEPEKMVPRPVICPKCEVRHVNARPVRNGRRSHLCLNCGWRWDKPA